MKTFGNAGPGLDSLHHSVGERKVVQRCANVSPGLLRVAQLQVQGAALLLQRLQLLADGGEVRQVLLHRALHLLRYNLKNILIIFIFNVDIFFTFSTFKILLFLTLKLF